MRAAQHRKELVAIVVAWLRKEFPGFEVESSTDGESGSEYFRIASAKLFRRLTLTRQSLRDCNTAPGVKLLNKALRELEALPDGRGLVLYPDGRIERE